MQTLLTRMKSSHCDTLFLESIAAGWADINGSTNLPAVVGRIIEEEMNDW